MKSRTQWTDDELAGDWIRRFSKERRLIVSATRPDEDMAASQRIDSETFWAFDELHELEMRQPEHAWALILHILRLAPNDEGVLTNLAAGPLENLLAQHGRTVITWVEDEARSNPVFKDLLSGVWQSGIPELIWQRVQRAADS